MDNPSPLLTTKEVMRFLSVSRTTLWRMVKDGELPAFRIGGDLRYKREDIDAYLERNKIDPGDSNV